MNKRQKEVAQAQLDAEKATLKQLERHYKRALNDLNLKIQLLQSDELTVSRVYRIEHQKALKAQVEAILEKLHSDEYTTISQFLSESYTDAFIGNAYDLFGQGVPLVLPIDPKDAVKAIQTESKLSEDLYTSLGVDTDRLKKAISAEISRGIASDMAYEDIARNIASVSGAPLSRAKTIATTEAHRIQQAGFYDNQKKAKSKGADILRQWSSTFDGGTRETHRKLDGQLREMDEPFEVDGKKAMYPGDFGDPAEDCNCRCRVNQRARWALGDSQLTALKQTAADFGLDKTENFSDFKKKYLKAAEKPLEIKPKSGKIKVDKTVKGHETTPKKAEPGSVIDHISDNGTVDTRSFYGDSGLKERDIHTTDHGNPKWHNYGKHGEHAHDYEWNEDGSLKTKSIRELTDDERERNGDIL